MKYKVGDVVKIIAITEGSSKDLLAMFGTIHKITSLRKDLTYPYEIDARYYKEWKECELELYKPFTKLDFLLSLIK